VYKVSILVPIYGVEQFIERCSRSLFEQTYQRLEFIFVNDCSPDRSVSVLKEVITDYPERKDAIKIVEHERNRGLAAARNTGLNHATGEFVICVDSDDWLVQNTIELLVDKQLESDADIVSGDRLIHYDCHESILPATHFRDKEQMVLQMMQHTWDHFVTGRLFRGSIFFENGLRWQEGFDVAEDRYMMTLLAYHAHGFDSVNSIVYHYERSNFNALTNTVDVKRVFRNNHQELGNVLFLEEFFRNKEIVYQKECSRCIMEQLANNIQAAISYRDKDEYNHVVDIIKSRSDSELKLIGWNKNSLLERVRHCYGYIVFSRRVGKMIRGIRKRVKAVLGNQ